MANIIKSYYLCYFEACSFCLGQVEGRPVYVTNSKYNITFFLLSWLGSDAIEMLKK